MMCNLIIDFPEFLFLPCGMKKPFVIATLHFENIQLCVILSIKK